MLIQAANLCFAFGQVAYRRLDLGSTGSQRYNFGWFFVGATVISLVATALFADWNKIPSTTLDYGILIWLGLVASGLGYWLWNAGARQVNANQLAVMNNVLIPAGLVVNFVFWQQERKLVDFIRRFGADFSQFRLGKQAKHQLNQSNATDLWLWFGFNQQPYLPMSFSFPLRHINMLPRRLHPGQLF